MNSRGEQRVTSAEDRMPRIERVGSPNHALSDLYYFIIASPWWAVLAFIAAAYLAANVAFALLYMLGGPGTIANARSDGFVDYFYFSVQTMSTIGYGNLYPKTAYAEFVVTLEAVVGLLATALATGLVFAKFARPRARVLFSRHVLFNEWNGKSVMMFRVGNARGNDVVEASIRVALLKPETTLEGHNMRRLHDVKLRRSMSPVFQMSWLVIHDIDEDSPFFGETLESLNEKNIRMVVSLMGLDGTFSQTVHARHAYDCVDFTANRRFADLMETLDDGSIRFDYRRFHDTVSMSSAPAEASSTSDDNGSDDDDDGERRSA